MKSYQDYPVYGQSAITSCLPISLDYEGDLADAVNINSADSFSIMVNDFTNYFNDDMQNTFTLTFQDYSKVSKSLDFQLINPCN